MTAPSLSLMGVLASASRLKSIIGMGTGAGAYILTRFAVSSWAYFKYIKFIGDLRKKGGENRRAQRERDRIPHCFQKRNPAHLLHLLRAPVSWAHRQVACPHTNPAPVFMHAVPGTHFCHRLGVCASFLCYYNIVPEAGCFIVWLPVLGVQGAR